MWHRQRASGQGESMWREWCGSSGVAAAADGSSWTEPAGGDQSGSRACVRAGAQTWRSHLRGRQRGRSERASGSWRTFFEFTPDLADIGIPIRLFDSLIAEQTGTVTPESRHPEARRYLNQVRQVSHNPYPDTGIFNLRRWRGHARAPGSRRAGYTGEHRSSEVIRGQQRSSVAVRRTHLDRQAIRGHQWGHQAHSPGSSCRLQRRALTFAAVAGVPPPMSSRRSLRVDRAGSPSTYPIAAARCQSCVVCTSRVVAALLPTATCSFIPPSTGRQV